MNTIADDRLLPIGIQSFEKLRDQGFLYVDKTDFVYKLANRRNPCFLSRPRRFGKSLLLSTFEAYYLGKKELFKGLAIEQLEQNWYQYPVLHLDLNAEKYDSKEALAEMLERQLLIWEELYETGGAGITHSGRFMSVIRKAYEKTGCRVVVLIDEYDKPMLRSMHDEALQNDFRETLTAFYTVLKSADPYLQFVFITGVTKFAQMGIFSNLNQLNDISFDIDYDALCGMTQPEIEATFHPELEAMAAENGLTYEETMTRITRQYDGYRFTPDEDFHPMYNPFSVLSALSKKSFGNYWFACNIPTYIDKMLQKTDYDLMALDAIEVPATCLSADCSGIYNLISTLYQNGYLTIKKYDDRLNHYTLGFPNHEEKYGFLDFVAPYYTSLASYKIGSQIVAFVQDLRKGDTEAFLARLRAFFADIPYELNDKTERHYQVIFYLVFKLMGQFSDVEVRSAKGRADAVVKTADYIFVFEFKLNGTAEEALAQIDSKGYLIPYTADSRRLVKVGVNFSAAERNLDQWQIR